MKQLVVMRHAKSDWHVGASDLDRPLNERGVAAATTMGRVLAAMDLGPDLVLTSPATRARTTAELVVAAGGWSVEVVDTPAFYEAAVDGVLARVALVPADVDRLLVVGHMPTWGGLVWRLTGASAAIRTATTAVLDLHLGRSWSHHGDLTGDLVTLLQPRHLAALDPGPGSPT